MEITRAGEPGYAEAVAGFSLASPATPELAASAASVADVQEAVGAARRRGLKLHVQGAGHGGMARVDGGLLLSTRHLDQVAIDAEKELATVGAGARWGAVIAAAAPHGLLPITGSSPLVGVAGFLLGGGHGPLARSHGVGSDYLAGASLVDAAGELRRADAELLWALRGGGKLGFGVLTSLQVRLVRKRQIYAGALHIAADIERVMHAWLAWTRDVDPRVSSSAAVMPGGGALHLRFAFPGSTDEGKHLAAPLRALARGEDSIRVMTPTEMATIHNDPSQPVASTIRGMMLRDVDDQVVTRLFAAQRELPLGFELRHLGEATRRDLPEGSAVAGREAGFTLGLVAVDPSTFATRLPKVFAGLYDELASYRSAEGNPNFHGWPGDPARLWRPEVWQRLVELRRRRDPDGLFSGG